MPRSFTVIVTISLLIAGSVYGQVDEIKSASSSHSSERGSSGGGSSSGNNSGGFVVDFFFNIMFSGIVRAQSHAIQRKHEVPSIISLDLMLQGAAQPSSYYILTPRIRGNWGLFSTDFRMNYLIEEDIGGIKFLKTNDWQMLQLNLVNTRDVNFRIGGGILQEAFEGRNSFPEWTTALQVRPWGKKLGGIAEYRSSEARREINAHLHYSIFNTGALHGYLTAGGMFQRYYEQVNVWGFQGGLTLSLF